MQLLELFDSYDKQTGKKEQKKYCKHKKIKIN